jgi:hypothetical protein
MAEGIGLVMRSLSLSDPQIRAIADKSFKALINWLASLGGASCTGFSDPSSPATRRGVSSYLLATFASPVRLSFSDHLSD